MNLNEETQTLFLYCAVCKIIFVFSFTLKDLQKYKSFVLKTVLKVHIHPSIYPLSAYP